MDEPTLDCLTCGRAATLEVRLETLNDAAEWRTSGVWPTCSEHLRNYRLNVEYLRHNQRLVLMRCD